MFRTIAILAVIAAILIPVSNAGQPTAPFAPGLGTAARHALDANKLDGNSHPTRFVYIRCYVSDKMFDGAAAWRFGADTSMTYAYAIRSEKTVYMRGWICSEAKSFISKLKHNGDPNRAEIFSYSTLLHEALHIQGVKNENTTECLANDGIRWAAMNLYGVPKSEANRLSRVAFDLSAQYTGTKYHSVSGDCQRKLSHRDWTDFVHLTPQEEAEAGGFRQLQIGT